MRIIEQIEQYRKVKGLNKSTLCDFAKINRSNYSLYLKGSREPTAKTIEQLCSALECKIIIIDKNI